MEQETSLKDFLTERVGSGGTSPEPPAEPAAASQPTEPLKLDDLSDTPEAQPPADTAPDATGEDEPLFNSREFLQQHPELEPYAKQLQADYTRKTQAIAEQRRALEGVDTAAVQWVRQFNEALATNPEQARAMLLQEQERLFGGGAPPAPVVEDDPWVTDTERQLATEVATVKQQLAEIKRQSELAEVQRQMHQQFDALEKEVGQKIPHEDRLAHIQRMAQLGLPYNQVATYYWGTAGREKALQMGREEGMRLAQQKAVMGGPPSSQVMSEPRTEPEPKSLVEALERKGLGAR